MKKIHSSQELIDLEDKYGAHNYHPLGVVISHAEGIWVTDPEGQKYIDMLSAYSAVNHGHRHPKIVKAIQEQINTLTLTSRAFYNNQFPLYAQKLAALVNKDKILPMNTGAEAVETAIKTMRKWGYEKKNVEQDQAEIIVFEDNFHGRTTTIISFSIDPLAKTNFGPYTPGFKIVPYNNLDAVKQAVNKNTVGILVEPIQGEAGVIIPDVGFLKGLSDISKEHNILLAVDEIQTGFGRTGELFAFLHENITPDIIIMGKALGGGVYPVSAIAANIDIMDIFTPGCHGSTFGGNPLGCAIGMAAIDILVDEKLSENSKQVGNYFKQQLIEMQSDKIELIRGKGLFIGVVIRESAGKARNYTQKLKEEGLLCKETHDWIIRFAPPLIITKEEIDFAMEKIRKVLGQ